MFIHLNIFSGRFDMRQLLASRDLFGQTGGAGGSVGASAAAAAGAIAVGTADDPHFHDHSEGGTRGGERCGPRFFLSGVVWPKRRCCAPCVPCTGRQAAASDVPLFRFYSSRRRVVVRVLRWLTRRCGRIVPPRCRRRTGTRRREMWVDFMADCGDGFDPSYAIARLLAQPRLRPPSLSSPSSSSSSPSSSSTSSAARRSLPRGEVLVIGGDLARPMCPSSIH